MPSAHCLEGLKPARIRTGIEVEALAESMGVSVTSYYRYEAGHRRIYFDKACRLADALGVSLDDLRRAPASDTVVAAAALGGWDA
jgi:transcriptional regulator with XRE-family HTH domain